MSKPLWSVVMLVLAFAGLSAPAAADVAACGCYCGKVLRPPCSDEACKQACGWQAPASPSTSPSYDEDAERRRQETSEQRRIESERQRVKEEQRQEQEAEALRIRQDEEAKRRQNEFERSKQNVLKSMKGISEGELGLKGGATGDMGLKGTIETETKDLGLKEETVPAAASRPKKLQCEWGDQSSQVVDLRCLGLDPNKPIVLDPNVAKGKERVIPAQIDPKTFENANYAKGFEALKRFDVESAEAAVGYFKAAQKERARDPLVRNGLLLAQDILKARQEKQRSNRAQAAQLTLLSYASLMMGDDAQAKLYSAQARKLVPKDNSAKFIESLASANLQHEGASPDRKYAYRLVANSLVFIQRRDYGAAVVFLESARHAQPQDPFIDAMLSELRSYGERPQPATGK